MNFEFCKRCLSYDDRFFIILVGKKDKAKIRVTYAVIASKIDSVMNYCCSFDCNVLVDDEILVGDFDSHQHYDAYQLSHGKENDFFDLIKDFDGKVTFDKDLGMCHCHYCLEHFLYDWGIKQ